MDNSLSDFQQLNMQNSDQRDLSSHFSKEVILSVIRKALQEGIEKEIYAPVNELESLDILPIATQSKLKRFGYSLTYKVQTPNNCFFAKIYSGDVPAEYKWEFNSAFFIDWTVISFGCDD